MALEEKQKNYLLRYTHEITDFFYDTAKIHV